MENKAAVLEVLNKMCDNTLMETLRITYTDFGDDFLIATMPVDARVHQPDGVLNGGATMAMAESVGSPLSMMVVDREKFFVRGISFSANHLRGMRTGILTATARFIHQGRTTHLVEITLTNEEGKIVSICKLTNIVLEIKK
ncbi:MAG: hotdog fold thioesterase [Flavobacteriaceae bacterium]|nr:hotdog fold thioesterase [Flavobacteriaceae bacterium]